MTTQIQRRRGTTSEHSTFTGAVGEITVDTTKDTVVVHDGSTTGGHPLAKENNPTFTGNVGIGTTSPSQKLHISTSDVKKILLTNNDFVDTTTGTAFDIGFGSTTGNTYTDVRALISGRSAWGNLVLQRGGGNVGIGTSAPDGKLHVHVASAGTVAPWANADDFVLENDDGGVGMSILAPDASQANIIFGSPSDNIGSIVRWVHDDGELQIGTHKSDGFLTLKTAIGQERLRITSAGNVGIGTSSPAAKLVVAGSGDATSTNVVPSEYTAHIVTDTAFLNLGSVSGRPCIQSSGTGTGYNLLLNPFAGNVGIGTSLPLSRFDVTNGYATFNWNNDDWRIRFTRSDQSWNAGIKHDGFGDTSFWTSNTERLRIDSSGRLLVGTNSSSTGTEAAQCKLVVAGNVAAGINGSGLLNIQKGSASNSTNYIGRIVYSDTTHDFAYIDSSADGSTTAGRLVFSTTADGASAPTERMRITAEGNIGTGNQDPGTTKLRIGGTVEGAASVAVVDSRATVSSDVTTGVRYFRGRAETEAASFNISNISIFEAGQGTIGTGSTVSNQYGFIALSDITGATNNYGFHSNIASGTNRWNFYANGTAQNYFAGDVLCGTTTEIKPWESSANGVEINSNIKGIRINRDIGPGIVLGRTGSDGSVMDFYRAATNVGSISVTTTATAYNTSSDYRLKENVTPMVGAADRIKALKPCRFNFISDATKTVDGFLAHEAQEVVPESVTGTKDEMEDIGTLTEWDGTILETNTPEPDSLTWDETITDEDGNETVETRTRTWVKTGDRPVMQGIDQAKLVPLLTGALQEALAEIDALKQRLTAAGL